MMHLHKSVRLSACALGLSLVLTACNDYVPSESETPAPQDVQGIATPSSVSVVTATNAD